MGISIWQLLIILAIVLVLFGAKRLRSLGTDLGGAIKNYNAETSAFGQRDMDILIGIEANWEDPNHDDANVTWARGVAEALQPFTNQRRYLNFPGLMEDADFFKSMFANTAERVQAVKTKYDSINLFRL